MPRGENPSDPACAPLLELLVDTHLARRDLDAARAALERLTSLATTSRDDSTAAAAKLAAGRLRAAEGDELARSDLHAAVEAFSALDLPFESARAQLELARVLAAEAPAGAAAEARSALPRSSTWAQGGTPTPLPSSFERSDRPAVVPGRSATEP
jgi:ATP/maltotriose-dependent transcriptional regulator MalT